MKMNKNKEAKKNEHFTSSVETFVLASEKNNIPVMNKYFYLAQGMVDANRDLPHVATAEEFERGCEQAIVAACRKSSWDAVKWLLKRGVKIGLRQNSPVLPAVSSGNVDVIKLVLENGTANFGLFALHLACFHGQISMVELFIEYASAGTSILHRQDSKGDTALHSACRNNQVKMAKFLLRNGSDAAIENDAGDTPLDNAGEYLSRTLLQRQIQDLHIKTDAMEQMVKKNNTVLSRVVEMLERVDTPSNPNSIPSNPNSIPSNPNSIPSAPLVSAFVANDGTNANESVNVEAEIVDQPLPVSATIVESTAIPTT